MSTKGSRRDTPGKAEGLTRADLVVLSLIAERAMHGYALLQEYDRQEVADWAPLSRPHVYYALNKLAAGGFIAPRGKGGAPRRRVVYAATPAGRAALGRALASAEWAREREATPFTTWLGLSIHARPSDRRRVVAARRAFLAEVIAKEGETLRAIAADSGARARVAAIMVGLFIEQCGLERAWLARLEAELAAAAPKRRAPAVSDNAGGRSSFLGRRSR